MRRCIHTIVKQDKALSVGFHFGIEATLAVPTADWARTEQGLLLDGVGSECCLSGNRYPNAAPLRAVVTVKEEVPAVLKIDEI